MSKFFFLAIIFSLILVDPTNADFVSTKTIKNNQLSATTFNFSNLNTINESNVETLFDINNIFSGGYAVNTLRIKNEGKTNLNYSISFKKESGDDNFCRNLKVEMTKIIDNTKYQNNLTDLNIKDKLDSRQEFVDWLIFLKLDQSFISTQPNECFFYFEIDGRSGDSDQYGFKYHQKIFNKVIFSNKR
jgi:hypothetical protein